MTDNVTDVDDAMFCLTVAAHGAITDHADVLVRGCLKEHPALVGYRLDLLEQMIATVRERCQAEELEWRRDEVAGGWQLPDPAAEHHAEVAEFRRHTGCCDWCLGCTGHDDESSLGQEALDGAD